MVEKSNETASADGDHVEVASDTFSIDSSVTNYPFENGRRYHAYHAGAYWAPNDDKQNTNLEITHQLFSLLQDGKLYSAPLAKDIERALDIGTGTGSWAIEFADEFPNTLVIGTDLSPIQPALVPPNCMFEIDDCTDTWLYPESYFDYIHIRTLLGSVPDWDTLYSQAYRHLKPGAFIEHFEVSTQVKSDDGTLTEDNPLNEFSKLYQEAGGITGVPFLITEMMKPGIEKAGFGNIVQRKLKVPLGTWPKSAHSRQLGLYCLNSFDSGLEGWAMATFTRVLGWGAVEVQIFLAGLRKASRDPKTHLYYEVTIVYGQKPMQPDVQGKHEQRQEMSRRGLAGKETELRMKDPSPSSSSATLDHGIRHRRRWGAAEEAQVRETDTRRHLEFGPDDPSLHFDSNTGSIDIASESNISSHEHSSTSLVWSDQPHLTTVASSLSSPSIPDSKAAKLHGYSVKEDQPHQDSDIQSIVSMDEDILSTAESNSYYSEARQAAGDYLVGRFTDDDELRTLYQEALNELDETRFIRNHRRLLKLYFLDLISERQSPSEKLASGFLRTRNERIRISNKICRFLQPSDISVRDRIDESLRIEKVGLYLANQRLLQESSAAAEMQDDTDKISEASEDSNDSTTTENEEGIDETNIELVHAELEAAAKFLTSGRPFISYKERLRSFLYQQRRPQEKSQTHLEKLGIEDARRKMRTQSLLQAQFVEQRGEFEDQTVKKIEVYQKEPNLDKDGELIVGNQAGLGGQVALNNLLTSTHSMDKLTTPGRESVKSSLSLEDNRGDLASSIDGFIAHDVRESTTATSNAKDEDLEDIFSRDGKSAYGPDPRPDTDSNASEETLFSQGYQHTELNIAPNAMSTIIATLSFLCFAPFSMPAFSWREQPLQPGKRRIRWTCWCGERLYDDFIESRPGAIQDLEATLNGHIRTRNPGTRRNFAVGAWEYLCSIVASIRGNKGNVSACQNSLPLHYSTQSSNVTTSSPSNAVLPPHLLLCMSVGQSGTKVYQELMNGVNSDSTLFSFINEAYRSHRRTRSWICLRTVASIDLVRFFLDIGEYGDIQLHDEGCGPTAITCTCLPPPDRVRSATTSGTEYHCQPIPAGTVPPIGKNYMMHYFRKPHRVFPTSTRIFNQFPKRLAGRLQATPDAVEVGWGVYFHEGWHWEAIFGLMLVVGFFGSVLFAILWSVLEKDIQGAFGVASYFITAATMLIGYIAARQN